LTICNKETQPIHQSRLIGAAESRHFNTGGDQRISSEALVGVDADAQKAMLGEVLLREQTGRTSD
tara:strand:+ start:1771 stop:1965 length:195 start_codon:yes stop_codon:yes gene_type:complete